MGFLGRVMEIVFLPNTGSVVVRSSQGRGFFFLAGLGSTNVIFGHLWTISFDVVLIFGSDLVSFHQLFIIPKS